MKKCMVGLMVMFMMIFSCSCGDREKSQDTVVKAPNSIKEEVSTENITSDIKHEINIKEEIFNLDGIIDITKLENLDKKELSILRNAVYAKYGYIFTSSKYKEYFSKIKWYQPRSKDVSNMLTKIDIENIDGIVEVEKVLEKSNESSKVFETTITSGDESYLYRVEFFLQENLRERMDQTFNQFKIYKIDGENMKMIFDSQNINDENTNEIISVANTARDILNIEDKDRDGMEEIFFTLEDILGYKTILVVEDINDKYVASFYGHEFEELKYKDVNKDGVMELISDHPGGGGYVSTWTGLDLVNELQGEKYNFSFDLTKQYYENIKEESEALFETSPTPECFVKLLNAYADLGMTEKCTNLIAKHSELVNSKEYDYSKHNDSPAETFFEYVVIRAGYYTSIWNEIKSYNSGSESEKTSNISGDIDTQELLDVADNFPINKEL
jgi:hypothetical protein